MWYGGGVWCGGGEVWWNGVRLLFSVRVGLLCCNNLVVFVFA